MMVKTPNRTNWYGLLEQHRRPYLKYLIDQRSLAKALKTLADELTDFLIQSVRTTEQAIEFWKAVPSVLARCDDLDTYELPMAPEAYAWLHLLDRYTRTWKGLEKMVQRRCLPLAIRGVNVLDIGTGPGPSTLAITDFYSSLSRYGELCGEPRLVQPTSITAMEFSEENNAFRSRFREVCRISTSETSTFPDIVEFDANEQREALRDYYLNQREWDEYTGRYEYVTRLTWDEEWRVSYLHRYRLVTLTNFVTTKQILNSIRPALGLILRDLSAGSIVVLIGGRSGHYPGIYEEFDKFAEDAGLKRKISDVSLSSGVDETKIIIEAARRVSEHIAGIAPMTEEVPKEVPQSLLSGLRWGGTSTLRVYRRGRYRMPSR